MGHWVRKDEEEYAKEVQRRRYSFKVPLVISSVLFGIIILVYKLGIGIDRRTGEVLSAGSWAEVLHQMPKFALASLGMGLVLYVIQIFSKRRTLEDITVICPKCQKVKKADNKYDCECGGKFADMERMKWVEDD